MVQLTMICSTANNPRGFKQLTDWMCGPNLYQTPRGAYTLKQYDDLLAREAAFVKTTKTQLELDAAFYAAVARIPVSFEMSVSNERCIDKHGMSTILW